MKVSWRRKPYFIINLLQSKSNQFCHARFTLVELMGFLLQWSSLIIKQKIILKLNKKVFDGELIKRHQSIFSSFHWIFHIKRIDSIDLVKNWGGALIALQLSSRIARTVQRAICTLKPKDLCIR
jgi:hypothetical protein